MIDPITGGACLLIWAAMQGRKRKDMADAENRMNETPDGDWDRHIQAERDYNKARKR